MKPLSIFPLSQRFKKILKRTCITIVSLLAVFIILNFIFPLPTPPKYSPVITDNKGNIIHAFLTTDEQWRMKTELDEIHTFRRQTVIAKEDKCFYRHPGVKPLAIARAFFYNLFTGKRTSGASTITMQVARMMEPKKRNLWNKMQEMFRALQLEMK